MANLIVVERVKKDGVTVSFWEYLKAGVPVTRAAGCSVAGLSQPRTDNVTEKILNKWKRLTSIGYPVEVTPIRHWPGRVRSTFGRE